jgi:hypothetical protein
MAKKLVSVFFILVFIAVFGTAQFTLPFGAGMFNLTENAQVGIFYGYWGVALASIVFLTWMSTKKDSDITIGIVIVGGIFWSAAIGIWLGAKIVEWGGWWD